MLQIARLAGFASSGIGDGAAREGMVDGEVDDALILFVILFLHYFLSEFGARK